MEESMICSSEISSIAGWSKKRKLQADPIGVPFPKHICWGQTLELYGTTSDSITDPMEVRRGSMFGESDHESAISYSSPHDDAKTYHSYPKPLEFVELSTPCASWDVVTSAEMTSLYSVESRSVTKPGPTKSETIEALDHLLEFGTDADYSFSEYQSDDVIDHCSDKDLDNLLSSEGVLPSDYVLSSGRWPVNQGNEQAVRKPTIDKEFEDYFSMLMM